MSAAPVIAEGRKEYKDEQLLARLIGAAVLLVIAVIVLPFVLDGAGSQREYEYARTLPVQPPRPVLEKSFSSRQPLPQAPKIEEIPIVTRNAAPVFEAPVQSVDQGGGNQETPLSAATATQPAVVNPAEAAVPALTPVVPPFQPMQIPLGYNIQVASFVKQANAQKLLARLQSRNLPAYINQVQGKSRPILRVFVGPIESQIDALALKNQVDANYQVESILVTRN